ncbi:small kinetochore-associated protein isoform X2 [Pogona vitticeps]
MVTAPRFALPGRGLPPGLFPPPPSLQAGKAKHSKGRGGPGSQRGCYGYQEEILNMENEKSRIPVYSFQRPKAIIVPKDGYHSLHSKRQCLNKMEDLEPLKNPDFTFGGNVPLSVTFKDANQRAPKSAKKVAVLPPKKPVIVRSPMNRYKRELELRNNNKLLETVKCELNLKLARIQKEMKEVKEKSDSLEKENEQLKRFQENCMLILETRNCDAGTNILEETEENRKTQDEIMDLSEKLKAELELFIQLAKEQKDVFQNSQMKWKQVEEEEALFLEQRQLFHKEMEELFTILNNEEAHWNPS